MAEGGHPAPKEEEEDDYPKWNWDRGSLEYVFASDFIHFVIEREDKYWRSHKLIVHRSPVTPFNTAIQNAVEGVLKKDSTCLRIVFCQITKHCGKLNQVRFNMCAVFLKLSYFGTLHSFGSLLKYFCMISQFSVWALGQGLHTAPFFCVDIIMGYIREFLVEHHFTSMDDFWYFFEREAGDALQLPNIWTLKDEDLRCLPDMQKLMELPSEEISSGVEGSSENLEVEEPEIEMIPPKYVEADASGDKVTPLKEECENSKLKASPEDAKVKAPSEEVEGSNVESLTEEVEGSNVESLTGETAGSNVESLTGETAGSNVESLTGETAGSNVKSGPEKAQGSKKTSHMKHAQTSKSSRGSRRQSNMGMDKPKVSRKDSSVKKDPPKERKEKSPKR